MTRPYVEEVEFTIQGGGKFTLGPKTLIIGPNRIGKSSIVRAVELALSGRASDVAGRDTLALDAELWTLAPGDAEVASVSALFNDGETTAAWALQRGKKAKRNGPTALLPIRDVTKAILGSADTARKFFLSVAGRVSWDDVLAEFPPQFHEKLAPYRQPDGAAGLLLAIEGTKKRVRDLNAEAKAQRATANTTSNGLGPPPSKAEIEKARKAAESGASRVGEITRAKARLAEIDVEGKTLADRLEAAQRMVDETEKSLAELPPPLPEVVAHAIAVGEHLARHDADACVICGRVGAKGLFEGRVRRAKAAVAEAMKSEERRGALSNTLREAKVDVSVLYHDAERLVAERERLTPIAAEPVPEGTLADYSTIVTTAAKWEAVRVAEGRAVEIETEAANLSKLTTLAQTAMERLLDKSKRAFEERVQKYLPPTMRFGVELRDGDRDVMRVGFYQWPNIEEPGILRTALSGAEWASMTVALAAAVAEGQDPTAPMIIVPEDRDFDSNTLAEVMESFKAIDGQVILAGTKPPAKPVEGWTVIDLGAKAGVPYCASCRAWIVAGPCPHGHGARATRGDADDFFAKIGG